MANDITYTIGDRRTELQDFTPQQHDNIHVYVAEHGSVVVDQGYALTVRYPAENVDVMIDGTVRTNDTGYTAAIWIVGGNLTVGATGNIGRFSTSNGAHVVNHGMIQDVYTALSGNKIFNIVNNGTIIGSNYNAIEYYATDVSGYALTVDNSGTIKGKQHAIFVTSSAPTGDTVTNTGLIQSNGEVAISLMGGQDLYDGRGGTVIGSVDLGEGNDTALGGEARDIFHGGSGDDRLEGNGGNDVLDGGAGADVMAGGKGDDTYYIDDPGDVAFEYGNEGTDTILTTLDADISAVAIENVTLQGAANRNITANLYDNVLIGNDGKNVIDGGMGRDVIRGGGGDDTLQGSQDDDTLDGGAGVNVAVFAKDKANYTITHGQNGAIIVEDKTGAEGKDTLTNIVMLKFADGTVTLSNSAPDNISLSKTSVAENALVNTIIADLSAHDADGDAVSFRLVDDAGGFFKIDGNHLLLAKPLDYETQVHQRKITVEAKDPFGATFTQSFTLDITDVLETSGSGGSIGDTDTPLVLIGTPRKDTLVGEGGNDVIKGLASNDTLKGGVGNDELYGGLGNDLLAGGAGQDVFVFDTRLSKTNAANRKQNVDKITDFSVVDDTIWLAKNVFKALGKKGVLSKKEFHIGPKAHDGDDHVIYNKKTGALYYDADGSGVKEAIQIATLARNLKINEKDFLVM